MFLIDKYRPTDVRSVFFHKELLELLQNMSHDSAIPHIIFYGAHGVGKKTIINLFLEMIFDNTVHKTKIVNYDIVGSGNKICSEEIKQSNYHIVIDPKNNNSDRYLIHDVVKEYAKIRPFNIYKTNRNFKVVLINNLDNLTYYAQTSLRRTMEIYNKNCRFIMWCHSLSKVIKPLQSRCICIRVPSPSNSELFKYAITISCKEKVPLSLEQYNEIVQNANGNIKIVLWDLQYYKFGYSGSNSECKTYVNKIINLLLENNDENIRKIEKNIKEIESIIYGSTITNIDGTEIMRELIDNICKSDKFSDSIKQKIIFDSAEIEYRMAKGRRQIIHFRNLIISILMALRVNK
jgi:replication factor C subunit 3/5